MTRNGRGLWWRRMRDLCVARIYATHNRSTPIQQALSRCLNELRDGEIGLNVGSGATRLHPRMLNLDIENKAREVDVCGRGEQLPLASDRVSVVVTQETLEHIGDPTLVIKEIHRVLREGGLLYCQVPFVIGYHPCPGDFQRWTREGLSALLRQGGFQCREVGIAVGPATGFYRILVEWWAVLFSCAWSKLYLPVKGVVALLFWPIKLLDRLMTQSPQADRIAGGYYIIGVK